MIRKVVGISGMVLIILISVKILSQNSTSKFDMVVLNIIFLTILVFGILEYKKKI